MNSQISKSSGRNLWLLAGGSAAIIIGLVFLAENLTRSDFDDLWALAFLPLALAFASRAVTTFANHKRVAGAVAGWALLALGTAATSLALVFGLDIGELWPLIFVITGGAAVLAAWR